MIAVTSIGTASFVFMQYIIQISSMKISRLLSFNMIFRLSHASMHQFYDRLKCDLLARRYISKISVIDTWLGVSTSTSISAICVLFSNMIVLVVCSSPVTAAFVVVYVYMCYWQQRYFMRAFREVVRLRHLSKDTMNDVFAEGVRGSSTIRTFSQTDHSLRVFARRVDDYQISCFIKDGLSKWMAVRVSLLSLLVMISSISFSMSAWQSASMMAIVMRYAITLTDDSISAIESMSDIEDRLVSYDRCLRYDDIEAEQGYKDIQVLRKKMVSGIALKPKIVEWPTAGNVSIADLKIRYSDSSKPAIDGVTLDIDHGSKVAIVGKPGSGVTSLLRCLYRYVEQYEGSVTIDGIELRNVDLKLLRNSISFVPENYALFKDTLRNNLDPMRTCSDNMIIKSIAEVGLWSKLKLIGGLSASYDQFSTCLSQGEIQLLSLARSLLFSKQLLIIEEINGNTDTDSTATLHRVLKTCMPDTTVIIAVARIDTLKICDRAVVVHDGILVENGSVDYLLHTPASKLQAIISQGCLLP